MSGTTEKDPALAVEDLTAAAGGKTLLPLTPIGEHGHIAYFEDSEGNRVALHQAAG